MAWAMQEAAQASLTLDAGESSSHSALRRKAEIKPIGKLGRYELALELGSGGFATVYLARVTGPEGFEKFVALKRVHPHLIENQSAAMNMFLDEARIGSVVNHPNICRVFDFDIAGGAHCLAMEYLLGESLHTVMGALQDDPRSARDPGRFAFGAAVVAAAADGLHAAHEALGNDGQALHIVHRDVAPPNIFVRYDGFTQVMDFGIAAAIGRIHQTASGVIKGHLAYIAPEQFGKANPDRRVDVWALGVVLWELATGYRLFKRATPPETMLAVVEEPILPPRQAEAQCPPALEAIILKALDRNPEHRYPTAQALSHDLYRFLYEQGVASPNHLCAEWIRRLFPHGLARKQQVLCMARASLQHMQRVGWPDDGGQAQDPAAQVAQAGHKPGTLPLWRRPALWLAAALALLVVVGGTLLWQRSMGASDAAEMAGGRVHVRVGSSGLDVEWQGKTLGRAPGVFTLPVGRQQLRLVDPDSKQALSVQVEVVAGKSVELYIP